MGWFSGCTPTQHYTMLFNTFVMMTLFNQFAARKLNGEWNFFAGIQNNNTFLVLSVVEMGFKSFRPSVWFCSWLRSRRIDRRTVGHVHLVWLPRMDLAALH